MERSVREGASLEVSSFCNVQLPTTLFSSVIKTEYGWIVIKEMDKTIDDNIVWPWGSVQGALHDNVFTCLKVGLTAWTACGGVGEESLAVFTNRGMAVMSANSWARIKPTALSQRWQRELDGSSCCIMPYLCTRLSIYCCLSLRVTVASVLSHLVVRTWCFWKIKEKKIEKKNEY